MVKKKPATEHAPPIGDLPIGATVTDRGAEFVDAPASEAQAHALWCAERIKSGWSFGPVFSEIDRTDPRLVAWELLNGHPR